MRVVQNKTGAVSLDVPEPPPVFYQALAIQKIMQN
jgi:hypothetical protein